MPGKDLEGEMDGGRSGGHGPRVVMQINLVVVVDAADPRILLV